MSLSSILDGLSSLPPQPAILPLLTMAGRRPPGYRHGALRFVVTGTVLRVISARRAASRTFSNSGVSGHRLARLKGRAITTHSLMAVQSAALVKLALAVFWTVRSGKRCRKG